MIVVLTVINFQDFNLLELFILPTKNIKIKIFKFQMSI